MLQRIGMAPRLVMIVFVAALFIPNAFVALSTHKSRGGDFRGFLIAGNRLLHGDFLYKDSTVASNVTWPPFFAIFIVPFALLARLNLPATQALWYLLNAGAIILSAALWYRMISGKPLRWRSTGDDSFFGPTVGLAFVGAAMPILDAAVALQISPLLLGFLSLGFYDLWQGKKTRSGLWFGLAVAIKAFPALLAIYLLFRKEWRCTASMVLTAAILTLLPALRYGIDGYAGLMSAWLDIGFSGGYPLGSLNQSVYALFGRYIAGDPFIIMHHRMPSPPPGDPRIIAATWVHRGVTLGLLAALFYTSWRRKKSRDFAAEAAYMAAFLAIVSPIAWRNYYVLGIPAFMVLLHRGRTLNDRGCFLWADTAFILMTVIQALGSWVRPAGAFVATFFSNVTLGGLALLAGIVLAGMRSPRQLTDANR